MYGPNCKKCKITADLVREALAEAGREATVIKVSDAKAIAAAGIMSTPAMAVDGEVKSTGRIPYKDEIKAWTGG